MEGEDSEWEEHLVEGYTSMAKSREIDTWRMLENLKHASSTEEVGYPMTPIAEVEGTYIKNCNIFIERKYGSPASVHQICQAIDGTEICSRNFSGRNIIKYFICTSNRKLYVHNDQVYRVYQNEESKGIEGANDVIDVTYVAKEESLLVDRYVGKKYRLLHTVGKELRSCYFPGYLDHNKNPDFISSVYYSNRRQAFFMFEHCPGTYNSIIRYDTRKCQLEEVCNTEGINEYMLGWMMRNSRFLIVSATPNSLLYRLYSLRFELIYETKVQIDLDLYGDPKPVKNIRWNGLTFILVVRSNLLGIRYDTAIVSLASINCNGHLKVIDLPIPPFNVPSFIQPSQPRWVQLTVAAANTKKHNLLHLWISHIPHQEGCDPDKLHVILKL